MGVGWAEELGPFRSLGFDVIFKYTFDDAKMLFLDSPTGVGYSYSDDPKENHSGGDSRTAEDSYTFLVRWLERFPEVKTRDFYIIGESYAGHYIPQLAALIHERNKDAAQKINLKGIMVGNPSTDNYYGSLGAIDYWLSHAMISPKTMETCTKLATSPTPTAAPKSTMTSTIMPSKWRFVVSMVTVEVPLLALMQTLVPYITEEDYPRLHALRTHFCEWQLDTTHVTALDTTLRCTSTEKMCTNLSGTRVFLWKLDGPASSPTYNSGCEMEGSIYSYLEHLHAIDG